MPKLPSLKKLSRKIKVAQAHRKVRKQASGYKFALFDSVEFLNPNHWDSVVVGQSIFFQRSYFNALEKTLPTNLQQRYALIYSAGHPVAAIAIQIVDFSLDRVIGTRVSKEASRGISLLRPAVLRAGRSLKGRMLVCGNLFSWGAHGVCFAKNASASELWPVVTEVMYRIRRGERLSGDSDLLLIKDLSASQSKSSAKLKRMSYRPCETEPNMVLQLQSTWRTYADYSASLDKKYRKSARQIFEEIEARGITIELVEDISSIKHRLYELYQEVQKNNSLCLVSITPEYLVELKAAFAEKFRCTVLKEAGRIIGFVTTLKDDETAIGYFIGFDRKVAETAPLYLRLLHVVVEDSILLRCKQISLGRTALEPKARLGAKPEKMFIWSRHRLGVLNPFVHALVQVVPHNEAPERNPFKG